MCPDVRGLAMKLVLASASSARALVLERAGLAFTCDPADIDEGTIKKQFQERNETAKAAAQALAKAKAMAVSARHHQAWVIGADQMLVCNDRWFDKPADIDEARAHLKLLRGQTHELISAVCVVQNEQLVWRHVEHASMTMISFSDDFLDNYLEKSGPDILESVGVYRLEGLGPQLFENIDGNFFAILGLPLLPLLAFLREAGVLDT